LLAFATLAAIYG